METTFPVDRLISESYKLPSAVDEVWWVASETGFYLRFSSIVMETWQHHHGSTHLNVQLFPRTNSKMRTKIWCTRIFLLSGNGLLERKETSAAFNHWQFSIESYTWPTNNTCMWPWEGIATHAELVGIPVFLQRLLPKRLPEIRGWSIGLQVWCAPKYWCALGGTLKLFGQSSCTPLLETSRAY